MRTCGKLLSLGNGFYRWTIDDFLSKVSTRSCTMESPWFRLYYMRLCIKKDTDLLGLSFFTCDAKSLPRVHVELSMDTGSYGTREFDSGETDVDGSYHVGDWIPYSEFMKRSDQILKGGELTVFCNLTILDTGKISAALQENPPIGEEEVQEEAHSEDQGTGSECETPASPLLCEKEVEEGSDSDEVTTVSERKIIKKLQTDLKTILDRRVGCDVTIKIHGKEFPAHSFFLQARSPVFESMFSHEMVEKLSGVVVIEDCEPETFPDLLNYLYTGNTRHIGDENVCQLYTASDKYQVEELKEECAAYMKSNMSVDNFCDILTLALRHFEKDLIDLSTDFFCANVAKITKTAAWQTFLSENPTAGNELFLKFLSRENYQ